MKYNADDKVPTQKVYFSREQYEHLSRVFPEVLGTPKTTNEELRHWAGIRQVVKYVENNVRG